MTFIFQQVKIIMSISRVAKPWMKYRFFTSQNEIDVIFMTKNAFLFCIKYSQMIAHTKSTIIKYYIIFMMAYKHRSRKGWCNENDFLAKFKTIFNNMFLMIKLSKQISTLYILSTLKF